MTRASRTTTLKTGKNPHDLAGAAGTDYDLFQFGNVLRFFQRRVIDGHIIKAVPLFDVRRCAHAFMHNLWIDLAAAILEEHYAGETVAILPNKANHGWLLLSSPSTPYRKY